MRQEAIPVQQAAVSPPRTDDPAIKHEGEGTQKDWSIWRQTSTKVAVHLSATPQEFWFNVRQLMTFYATGLEPDLPQAGVTSYATQTQPSPAAQAQNAQQNQFIPDSAIEGDPGPAGGWPSDDDIPFAPTF